MSSWITSNSAYASFYHIPEPVIEQPRPERSGSTIPSELPRPEIIENYTPECSICFEKLTSNVTILPCIHKYHSNCINEWHNHSYTCPQCRKEF